MRQARRHAIRRTERIVNKVFDIRVGIHAVETGVNGMNEGVRRKNQRLGFSVDSSRRVPAALDDMPHKPLVKRLERFVQFHPRTMLREIIKVTAETN